MGRAHVEVINAAGIEVAGLPMDGWPSEAHMQVLSRDDDTGAVSGILHLPAGYRRPVGALTADCEVLVVSGSVRIGETLRGFGYYEFTPKGLLQEPWIVPERCEILFLARRDRPDFVADPGGTPTGDGTIRLETESMPWEETPIPGPPPGLVLKPLRADPVTGELSALWSHPSRFPAAGQYTSLEFHECAEESYCLSGDIWIGSSGTMVTGSYFWRPPYISHGPFFSRDGSLTFTSFDGPLANHLVDGPIRTPDENRAWLEAERAAGTL